MPLLRSASQMALSLIARFDRIRRDFGRFTLENWISVDKSS
jgi:hypothetical protein